MKKIFVATDTGLVRSGWVIVVYLLCTAAIAVPLGMVIKRLGYGGFAEPAIDDWRNALQTAPQLVAAVGATVVCRFAFKEKTGLESTTPSRQSLFGFALGAASLATVVLVPVLVGQGGTLSPFKDGPEAILLSGAVQFFAIGAGSVSEELATRGIIFHALARGARWWVALLATSLLFGIAHLGNPGATLFAAANVALVGVLFGLLTLRYSLWVSIGFHVAWNWFEGFFFGQPVSGFRPGAALISSTPSSVNGFWSGADFGPEASGFTTLTLAVLVVIFFLKFWKRPEAPLVA